MVACGGTWYVYLTLRAKRRADKQYHSDDGYTSDPGILREVGIAVATGRGMTVVMQEEDDETDDPDEVRNRRRMKEHTYACVLFIRFVVTPLYWIWNERQIKSAGHLLKKRMFHCMIMKKTWNLSRQTSQHSISTCLVGGALGWV